MNSPARDRGVAALCRQAAQALNKPRCAQQAADYSLQKNRATKATKGEKLEGTYPSAFPTVRLMEEEELEKEGRVPSV